MAKSQKPALPWATRMRDLLREEMERQGLSCPALARMTGINVRSLQRWTRGECLTVTALERVCAALGLDVEVRLVPGAQGGKQVPEVKLMPKEPRRKPPAPSSAPLPGEERLAEPETMARLERLAAQHKLSPAEWIRRAVLRQIRLRETTAAVALRG